MPGAAVAGALLFEQTKIRLDEEQFLYQIAQASASTIDTDTIMTQCTAHAARALSADAAAGFLASVSAKNTYVHKASVSLAGKPASVNPDVWPQLTDLFETPVPKVLPAEQLLWLKDSFGECASGPAMVIPPAGRPPVTWADHPRLETILQPGTPAAHLFRHLDGPTNRFGAGKSQIIQPGKSYGSIRRSHRSRQPTQL